MIQDSEIAYLLERLRYQYAATGPTTMGCCAIGLRGCLNPSRGGGTCPDCLVADLVKLGVPKAQAQAYQSILAQIQRLRIEAGELAERMVHNDKHQPTAKAAARCPIKQLDPLRFCGSD